MKKKEAYGQQTQNSQVASGALAQAEERFIQGGYTG
jgi:hypothetical protein